MSSIWYQCEDCIFGSNSGKAANEHAITTNHHIFEEED